MPLLLLLALLQIQKALPLVATSWWFMCQTKAADAEPGTREGSFFLALPGTAALAAAVFAGPDSAEATA